MTTRPFVLAAVTCLALAAASLALGYEPVYDAWAWLVWGRELAGLGLDTSSGPSWKPLPVALIVVLSAAGDAAPELWIVLVRAAWLFALVLAGELAWTLTRGYSRAAQMWAAAFAAVSLALLHDDVTMWARQGAAGMSEPLLVALALGAVRAAVGERPRLALALGALAALVRPEVWPLLALFGAWRWREAPRERALVAAFALAVPALWLAPDVLVAGDALSSAERAQRDGGGPLKALARAALLPLAIAWPLAAYAVLGRDRGGAVTGGDGVVTGRDAPTAPRDRALTGRDPRVAVLAAGALAWIATVAVMAAAGFPGLPRFMAPAAAVIGVLAGVGLARLRPVPVAVAWIGALAILVQVPGRAAELPHALRSTARIGDSHERLADLASEVGRARLQRCGRLATSDVLVRTALAWRLRVPLKDIVSFGGPPRLSGAFVVGIQAKPATRARLREEAELLGERGEWRIYSLDCPTAAASSSRSVGVSGARR